MARTIIGVMGAGDNATAADIERAAELGELIARRGWTLLTGGRNAGVMQAASKSAKESGGLVIGILPGNSTDGMSEFVDIPIVTGMGSARNNINVLSSKVVIACGMGAGTASEIGLALKAKRPVVLLGESREASEFFVSLNSELVAVVSSAGDAIEAVLSILEKEIAGEWKRPARPASTKTD